MSGATIHTVIIADWQDALYASAATRSLADLFQGNAEHAAIAAAALYELIQRLHKFSKNIALNIEVELEHQPQFVQVFLHGFDVHIPVATMNKHLEGAKKHLGALKECGCECSVMEKPGFGTVVALTVPSAGSQQVLSPVNVKEALPSPGGDSRVLEGEVAALTSAVLASHTVSSQPSAGAAPGIDPDAQISSGGLEFIHDELRDTRRNLKAAFERYDALVELKNNLRKQLETLRVLLSGTSDNGTGIPGMLKATDIKDAVKQVASISAQLESHFQSSMEVPAFDITVHRFSVGETFNVLQTVFSDTARKKNLDLQFELDPQVPEMNSDKSRIVRMLHHLIDNALKFTEAGHVRVTARKVTHKGEVVFTVEDSGIGISSDHHRNIFGDGVDRIHPGASHFSGLPVAKEIVSSLGGSIAVDSQVGHGSKFTIVLPIDYDADVEMAEAEENTTSVDDGAPVAEDTADKETGVLIVEDDEATQFLMKKILSAEYTCFGAASANEAFAVLGKYNIRFIYMDIALKGSIDGIELTRQLRSSDEWKDIPIIALTSFTHDMTRGEALCAGCDDYLTKPINKSEVLEKVKEFIRPYKAKELEFLS